MGKTANKCIVENLLPMCFIMFGPKMSHFQRNIYFPHTVECETEYKERNSSAS